MSIDAEKQYQLTIDEDIIEWLEKHGRRCGEPIQPPPSELVYFVIVGAGSFQEWINVFDHCSFSTDMARVRPILDTLSGLPVVWYEAPKALLCAVSDYPLV